MPTCFLLFMLNNREGLSQIKKIRQRRMALFDEGTVFPVFLMIGLKVRQSVCVPKKLYFYFFHRGKEFTPNCMKIIDYNALMKKRF